MGRSNARVDEALAWLERRGTKKNVEAMARYGIVAEHAFGVSVGDIGKLAKDLGKDHDLALGLWETNWYEARMLAAVVDDPAQVTSRQMDAWARDFDNWAICDHCCFHLFDRTPHSWRKVDAWSDRKAEFVKRAAFATLAGLSLHDKNAADDQFIRTFPIIERAADDDRNFVKKGVSWALRVMGRRNPMLHSHAVASAARLLESESGAARWIGRDAHRELTSAKVKAIVARKKGKRSS
jgi:3-methyladenine DNA glycosylase AlkD